MNSTDVITAEKEIDVAEDADRSPCKQLKFREAECVRFDDQGRMRRAAQSFRPPKNLAEHRGEPAEMWLARVPGKLQLRLNAASLHVCR